jgi:hypothetical protein
VTCSYVELWPTDSGHRQLLVILHRPQQIGDLLLPIAEGGSADHTTVFKGGSSYYARSVTHLRNTSAYLAGEADSELRVT